MRVSPQPSRISTSNIWATAGVWGHEILGLAAMLVLARLLAPDAFGLVGIAMLFVLLFQRVLFQAFSDSVVRTEDAVLSDVFLNTCFFLSVATGVALCASMFAASTWIAAQFGEPALAPILAALSVLPLLDALTMVHLGVLRRQLRYRELTARRVLATASGAVAGIGCALLWDAGAWSLVVQQVVAAAAGAIALWRWAPWRPGRQCSRGDAARITRFGVPMSLSAVTFVTSNRLDLAAVGLAGGASSAGIYTLAKRVFRTASDSLVGGVIGVSLSAFSAQQRDPAALERLFVSQLRLAAFIAFPALAGLAAVAEPVITLLLGEQWLPVVPVLQLLTLFIVPQVLQRLATNLLVALGHTGDVLVINVGTLGALMLLLWLAPEHTPATVAAVFVLHAVVMQPLVLWMVHRRMRMRLPQALMALAVPTVGCILMLLVLRAVDGAVMDGWAALPKLITMIVAGVVLYVAYSAAVQRPMLHAGVALIRSVRR